MADAIERWASFPGYEGLYRVSDAGRVFSIRTNKMLSLSKRGVVTVFRDGIAKRRSVKALVRRLFEQPETFFDESPARWFSFVVHNGPHDEQPN
jgi:hypothetical protein